MMNTLIASPTQAVQKTVSIPASRVRLEGELSLPENATGIVLFAHGSGRASPRNQKVAELIREAGIGTLLFDLLTEAETAQDQSTGSMRFDMSLLSARLVCATQWVLEQPETYELKIGYFGASTGGAAVLMAAAELGDKIAAIVLRGGRPDLAREALGHVTCPTLMIVGGYDEVVYFLNQEAFRQMKCKRALRTVPHASHLFEEPGKLEQVANFTADWFLRHMNHAGEERVSMTEPVFSDRRRAGLCLAESLTKYANRDDVIVLGVPRGGVPVAFEVAKLLRAPLDVIIVRKLGVPGYEELAMGAIASGGSQFIHETVMRALGVSPAALAAAIETETKELRRRELVYRGHAGTPAIKDRIVILIDDGVATGSALRAAILAVRAQQPQKLIVAAPVASYEAFTEIKAHADDLIALIVPMDFRSVGQWYEDFQPTSDEEITDLLRSRTDELIT